MRYRLIPTQGRSRAFYVQAYSDSEALATAKRLRFAHDDQPIMVCAAPEGGLVRSLGIVGDESRKVKR